MTRLTTLDGSTIELPASELQAFKAAFSGTVLTAQDPAYEETRQVWNAMIDRRPGLVARCSGTADVVQALRFARQHRLLLSVRGGGHNIAGLAVCDGGLMIDLSLRVGSGSIRSVAPRARKLAAPWATWTVKPSCTAWRRCSGSFRPPASRA